MAAQTRAKLSKSQHTCWVSTLATIHILHHPPTSTTIHVHHSHPPPSASIIGILSGKYFSLFSFLYTHPCPPQATSRMIHVRTQCIRKLMFIWVSVSTYFFVFSLHSSVPTISASTTIHVPIQCIHMQDHLHARPSTCNTFASACSHSK